MAARARTWTARTGRAGPGQRGWIERGTYEPDTRSEVENAGQAQGIRIGTGELAMCAGSRRGSPQDRVPIADADDCRRGIERSDQRVCRDVGTDGGAGMNGRIERSDEVISIAA